jgi:hypothetical protein
MPPSIALAALLILGIPAAPAGDQVKLEWKLQEGHHFYAECVTSFKGTVLFQGDKQEQEATERTVLGFTVLKRMEGAFVVEEKIASVRVTSAGGTTGFPAIPLASKWQGAVFRITLAPDGEVRKFEGYEAALRKVVGGNDNVQKMMRALLPRDAFRLSAEMVFGGLPHGLVRKGDRWKRPLAVELGPWGRLQADADFSYEGSVKEGQRIKLSSAVQYASPRGIAGLPFEIVGGSLKAEPATGTILFNAMTGRLLRAKRKIQFKGGLVFTTGKKKDAIRLEQERTITIRLSATRPAAKE